MGSGNAPRVAFFYMHAEALALPIPHRHHNEPRVNGSRNHDFPVKRSK